MKYSVFYDDYNNKLRPLVAEVESRFEQFEGPLLVNMVKMFDEFALYVIVFL